jgi:hypothetical protein
VVTLDTFEDPTKVNQKISINSFISTLNSKDFKWKEVYSNIDWSALEKYKYKEYEDFVVIEFFFYDDISYEKIDSEFGKENEKVDSFECKIWPKDKTEVLEILKDWYDKRGY